MNTFDQICKELFDGDDFNKVKMLLEKESLNLNQFSETYNDTPLMLTVSGDGEVLKMMELLLENGADPNFPGEGGYLVLEASIESAIDGNDYHKIEINTKEIELLLKYGADMNKKGSSGRTPYDFARACNPPALAVFEDYS